MPCDSGSGAAPDLWAMADELERQYAGYKQRLTERTTTTGSATTTTAPDHDEYDDYGGGDAVSGDGAEEEEGDDDEAAAGGGLGRGGDDVRIRMYEAYERRRDERLRDGWRERMERKEAEVKALWAQLELAATGRGRCAERASADGSDPTTATTTTTAAIATEGDDERKTERNDDDRRRSASDAALAPRRITGKKHARTRSFSSSMATTIRNRTDVGRRRSLSQEPPPSEPDASSGEATKERPRTSEPGGKTATTTATTRPRTSLRRRNSFVKGHGSAKTAAAAGPKLPRSMPRRPNTSSGGPEDLGRGAAPPVVQPSADAVAPHVPSSSKEFAGGTPGASPLRMSFTGRDDDSSGGTGAASARATSPEPDRGTVDEAVPHGEPEAKDAGVEEHGEEKLDANGETTSDSEPEPSYFYINKDAAEEQQAMAALSEPSKLSVSGADTPLDMGMKASEEMPAAPAPAEATAAAAEIAATNAEEAPARECSDESSLSVSVRSSGPSSRDQSNERLLEADAVVVCMKREERAEKSAAPAPRTPPGSAGSRFSGAARSPRGTTTRGFKRFLSFGKKHRGRGATVIDCMSPSVPSPADDDSGRWQPADGSIKPRMGSSDAASDDTDHGYPLSPQACSLQSLVAASPAKSELAEIVPQEKSPKVHRSFFSFRSLNCGRG